MNSTQYYIHTRQHDVWCSLRNQGYGKKIGHHKYEGAPFAKHETKNLICEHMHL